MGAARSASAARRRPPAAAAWAQRRGRLSRPCIPPFADSEARFTQRERSQTVSPCHVRSSASPTTTLFLAALAFSPDRIGRAAGRPRRLARRGARACTSSAHVRGEAAEHGRARGEALARVRPQVGEYGRHMTNEAVHARRRRSPRTARWSTFARFGATAAAATLNGDMVTVTVDVETAERMLGAKYVALEHVKSGEVVHRAPSATRCPSRWPRRRLRVADHHVPGVRLSDDAQPERPQPQRAEEFAAALLDRRGHGRQGAGQQDGGHCVPRAEVLLEWAPLVLVQVRRAIPGLRAILRNSTQFSDASPPSGTATRRTSRAARASRSSSATRRRGARASSRCSTSRR